MNEDAQVGIRTSAGIGELAGALAKAQGAFQPVPRSRTVKVKSKSTGAEYEFSYAPLDIVLAAVRPALAANGLAIIQEIHGDDVKLCTTTLMHSSGQWRASTVAIPGSSESAQEFGSRVTYIRRYTLQCILGVAAEEDDDANVAEGNRAGWSDRPRQQEARPRERQRSAPESVPPPAQQAQQPKGENALETKLLAAGHQKQVIQRWLMSLWGTANWRVLTPEQVALTEQLGEAWAAGGDEGHAAKKMELEVAIAGAKKLAEASKT